MTGPIECTRRTVLRFAWAGMVAVGALSVKPLLDYLTSNEDQPRSPLVSYDKSLKEKTDWQHVPNSRVWVKKDDQGITALVATCTHLGCEVTYHADKKEWLCPCHGSIYDIEGRPIAGPAPKALPRVAVDRKADGSLIINTEKHVGLEVRL
ncbi:Rieske Fe-S protein [Desulfosporosinus acidiphilus SJ4]|uniref:Rieske Fe-S protein n=1 Tax=Desulfosporosinus acidiphilus (strain DSM 22704 / JCM 16185 / SJ4) TaxID=646529 RepID=I4D8P0_DESAJ|nr:ubiquinol-cytochrome c reductase iron-sulfur subunit [Desulfosporosinus acidiphilus]AFM42164.1 Rieske Fe-S protein [Desulfosporosinus acidiphilus SJ4]